MYACLSLQAAQCTGVVVEDHVLVGWTGLVGYVHIAYTVYTSTFTILAPCLPAIHLLPSFGCAPHV